MSILINLNCNKPIIFRLIHWLETFSFPFHVEADIKNDSGASGEWIENEYNVIKRCIDRAVNTPWNTLFRMAISQNIFVTWPCLDQWHDSITAKK